jgi:hypothetical protein
MDSSGAADLDESLAPPPSSPLPPPRSPRGLFFRMPTEEEVEANPGTLALGTPEVLDGDGSVSGDPWSEFDEPSDDEHPTSTASPAGDKPLQLVSKKQMKETAEAAVKIGTGMAHTVAANTQAKKDVGLYLADDDDARAIGHPLAEIAYRRGDVVGGKLSPDANNALQAVFGLIGYFTKQVGKIAVVRQIEAGQAAGEVQTIPRDVA